MYLSMYLLICLFIYVLICIYLSIYVFIIYMHTRLLNRISFVADRKRGCANHRAKTSLSWHDAWHGLASGQPIYGHLLTPRARGDGHCGRLPAPPGTGSQKAPTMAAPPGTGSQKAPTVAPHVTYIYIIYIYVYT